MRGYCLLDDRVGVVECGARHAGGESAERVAVTIQQLRVLGMLGLHIGGHLQPPQLRGTAPHRQPELFEVRADLLRCLGLLHRAADALRGLDRASLHLADLLHISVLVDAAAGAQSDRAAREYEQPDEGAEDAVHVTQLDE